MADVDDANPQPRPLNVRHEQFVEKYVEMGNATKAYMAVYPDSSYEAARTSAHALLTNPNIQSAIAIRRADLLNEMGLTKQRVLQMMEDAYNAAISEGGHASAVKATELLGREHGLFVERTEQRVAQTIYTLDMGKELAEEDE